MARAFICQIAPDQTSDIKIKISGSELPQMSDVFTVTIIIASDLTLITIIFTNNLTMISTIFTIDFTNVTLYKFKLRRGKDDFLESRCAQLQHL